MQEGGWTQAMIPIIGVGVEVEYQNVEVNWHKQTAPVDSENMLKISWIINCTQNANHEFQNLKEIDRSECCNLKQNFTGKE